MGEKTVVEVVYGKYHKFEVVKDDGGILESPKFYLRRDGQPYRGSYSSLRAAVEAAKAEG